MPTRERDTAQRIAELREQGLANAEIARRLGVAQATVHYHLRRATQPPDSARRKPGGDGEPVPANRAARSELRTRDQVAALLTAGLSRAEIARRLGITKSTVSYHARRLGEPIDGRCRRRYDWEAVQAYYDQGHTMRECRQRFGFSHGAWNGAVKRGQIQARSRRRPEEEIFAADTHRHRGNLKRRLIADGLKPNRCERCGINEWLGLPLAISLHHVNGDRLDNRLENLQLLCPNCHSQTDTFAGRNGSRPLAAPGATKGPDP